MRRLGGSHDSIVEGQGINMIDDLPAEIIVVILKYLDVASRVKFSLCNSAWYRSVFLECEHAWVDISFRHSEHIECITDGDLSKLLLRVNAPAVTKSLDLRRCEKIQAPVKRFMNAPEVINSLESKMDQGASLALMENSSVFEVLDLRETGVINTLAHSMESMWRAMPAKQFYLKCPLLDPCQACGEEHFCRICISRVYRALVLHMLLKRGGHLGVVRSEYLCPADVTALILCSPQDGDDVARVMHHVEALSQENELFNVFAVLDSKILTQRIE